MKRIIVLVVVTAIVVAGYVYWRKQQEQTTMGASFASGNGRLEATEISISAKIGGRISEIMVNEGDFVNEGQPLVQMDVAALKAQLAQAAARRQQAVAAENSARAVIEVRECEVGVAKATLNQRESLMNGARKRYDRTVVLQKKQVVSDQELDDDEAKWLSAKADYEAAAAGVKQTEAALNAARVEAESAKSAILAAEADMASVQVDIDESLLTAPRRGRIQYRVAQKGEVVAGGGRILNQVDLTDVYMTFFLPEGIAGRCRIGTEVRLVLDCIPEYPIPAAISYVASVAQFTPKTVETQQERQKLMFRVKARIAPELLEKYIETVKTGLPGVAWVKMDPEAEWPEHLQIRK